MQSPSKTEILYKILYWRILMTNYLRKKGTIEAKNIAAGRDISMQVLVSSEDAPNFAMRRFIMKANGIMPLHTNLVEHEQYIISGSADVKIGDQALQVSAGDSVYIPAEVPHTYTAGAEGFEFICVVPNKEDKIEILEPLTES